MSNESLLSGVPVTAAIGLYTVETKIEWWLLNGTKVTWQRPKFLLQVAPGIAVRFVSPPTTRTAVGAEYLSPEVVDLSTDIVRYSNASALPPGLTVNFNTGRVVGTVIKPSCAQYCFQPSTSRAFSADKEYPCFANLSVDDCLYSCLNSSTGACVGVAAGWPHAIRTGFCCHYMAWEWAGNASSASPASLEDLNVAVYERVPCQGSKLQSCGSDILQTPSYSVSLKGSDFDGFEGTFPTFALRIYPPLVIRPQPPTFVTAGVAMQQQLAYTGGGMPGDAVVFSAAQPGVPGVRVNAAGQVDALFNAAGSFQQSVVAKSALGAHDQTALSFVVAPPVQLTVVPSALSATQFAPVARRLLLAAGGRPPLKYFVHAGELPAGLSVDESLGLLSGAPVHSGLVANLTFGVRDLNGATALSAAGLSMLVSPALSPEAPAAVVELHRDQPAAETPLVAIAGGRAPYTVRLVRGSLPPGLEINATTGALQGAPLQLGSYSLEVGVLDANLAQSAVSVTLEVVPQPTASANTGSSSTTVVIAITVALAVLVVLILVLVVWVRRRRHLKPHDFSPDVERLASWLVG